MILLVGRYILSQKHYQGCHWLNLTWTFPILPLQRLEDVDLSQHYAIMYGYQIGVPNAFKPARKTKQVW